MLADENHKKIADYFETEEAAMELIKIAKELKFENIYICKRCNIICKRTHQRQKRCKKCQKEIEKELTRKIKKHQREEKNWKLAQDYIDGKTDVLPPGFYKCIDCGIVCKRINSKQKRCSICQEIYSWSYHRIKEREYRNRNKKEKFNKFIQITSEAFDENRNTSS